MKTNAAVLWEIDGDWQIEEVDLDGPKEGEVLIEFEATGLCHPTSMCAPAISPGCHSPIIGGHEGAGIVQEIGPGVRDLKPGDHVVTSFLPACGRCRWCASGHQNLCDLGALILAGIQTDGTYRRKVKGHDVGTLAGVGSFAIRHAVGCVGGQDRRRSAVESRMPAGLWGDDGWGSAVNTADIRPGTPSSSSGSAASAAAPSRAPGWPVPSGSS